MSSVYAVGRPPKVGQRLKDGSFQEDLGNVRRDALFWCKVDDLVKQWVEKNFFGVLSFEKDGENLSQ